MTENAPLHFSKWKRGGPPTTDAVREGERIGNSPNRWHLVKDDTGIGPLITWCNRVIPRSVAETTARVNIEREKVTSRTRRCKRCWA